MKRYVIRPTGLTAWPWIVVDGDSGRIEGHYGSRRAAQRRAATLNRKRS